MIRRRGRQSEFQSAVRKFLEHNRDPGRRLKALRQAEEKAAVVTDVKELYQKYSSAIFFVFYSYFGSLESAILDKANKGRGYSEVHLKELRDTVLPALERILVYLPELVHKKWQYNSLCLIIRKLLHPENVLKLRKDGLRLLTLWLHALQSNAGDASMQLFASAVPHFPPLKTPMGLPTPSPSSSSSSSSSLHPHSSLSLVERYGTYSQKRRSSGASASSAREVVKVGVLQPLHSPAYPGAVDASDSIVTFQLTHYLMDCLTQQVGRLHWEDPAQHLHGFSFLFFLFKLFYLACLFKNFRSEAGLYSQSLPPDTNVSVKSGSRVRRKLAALKEEESTLDHGVRSPSPSSTTSSASALHKKHLRRAEGYRMSQVIKLEYDLSHPVYTEIKRIILECVLSWLQPDKDPVTYPLKSPLPSPSLTPTSPHLPKSSSFLPSGSDLICEMWFTSRDNVNLLCEICRQSFLMSPAEAGLIRRVIELYWSWVSASGEKPLFMTQPATTSTAPSAGEGQSAAGSAHLSVPLESLRPSSPCSILPWEVLIRYEGHDASDVCAGLQPTLRMVISHMSQVFLVEERNETRSSQMELCRRVVRFYQELVMLWTLDHDSWEYLLSTLLHLNLELLRGGPPRDRDSPLSASLATMMLKTLLVCYLRASMVTRVSGRLWDSLASVFSSLTQWREVIEQWEFVMDTMTQILAQTVYNLDLKDLPLQRLLRDEDRRGRGRDRTNTNVASDLNSSRFTAFSVVEANMRRPNTATSMHVSQLASISRSAEDRRSRGKMQKAYTVEVQTPSPPPGRGRRYVSIPCVSPYSPNVSEVSSQRVGVVGGGVGRGGSGGVQGRSVSEVEQPIAERLDMPMRSHSSEGQYGTILEEEGEGESGGGILESDTRLSLPPSPAVSLPATVALSASTGQEMQRSQSSEGTVSDASGVSKEAEESLTIANLDIRSPILEPEVLQSPGISDERAGSVEPLITSRGEEEEEEEERTKEKTKKSIFGLKKLGLSDLSDGKPRKRYAARAEAANDLVFANESSEDSGLADEEHSSGGGGRGGGGEGGGGGGEEKMRRARLVQKSSPSSSLVASWTAGVTTSEMRRGDGYSMMDGSGVGGEEEEEEEGARRGGRKVYKSSSESNIYRLIQLTDVEEEEEEESRSIMSSPMMRRMASSDAPQSEIRAKKKKRSVEMDHEDIFSSAIIPSSLALLGTSPVGLRSQSPVLSPVHPILSPVHPVLSPLSSPQSRPSSQLALRRTVDQRDRDGSGGTEAATEGGGGFEGSGEAEFQATPLHHRMMVKKSLPVENPRTPSPPITISSPPTSPPHAQIQVGWTAVVSAVVWQRMLKILGDVNAISDPAIHHLAFLKLLGIWRLLEELDANLGVSMDNQTTPPLPTYRPPLLVFLPWVLCACSLPPAYLPGRTVAVQLLCEMNIHHLRTPPSLDQLTHFYRLLQQALQPSSDTLNVAVKYCSKLFSHGLPGAGVLLGDCISACAAILSVKTRRPDVPRTESLCLLGSMLFLPHLSPQLRGRLVDTLLTAARREPTRTSRCMALHMAGMMAFSEFFSGKPSSHLPEALDILLASLMFSERSVSMTAIDMLTLLTEVAPQMRSVFPAMPAHILEGLCYSITVFMTDPELEKAPWVSKVVVTLLMCLRDWLMVLPLPQMMKDSHISHTVLREAFEVLQAAAISSKQASAKRHAVAQLASIKSQVAVKLEPLESLTHNTSPASTARSSKVFRKGDEGAESPHLQRESLRPLLSSEDEERVQLAARSVLTHLLNLVGHFPFGCGPAQMTSIVSEFHDAPSLKHLDELSTEIFDSPRVQFFSFNDTAVVTLVEIPIEHVGLPPTVEPAHYHSRVIVRDVTGKYAWDCAMLYGPQMCPQPDGIPLIMAMDSDESLSTVESTSLDGGAGGVASSAVADPAPYSQDPLQPPSWKTHTNSDRDVLEDLLKHIESTSPECLLYPGVAGLAEPAPVASEAACNLEEEMVEAVQRQHSAEMEYRQAASTLPSMSGGKEVAPAYISAEFAYHHCRVLLSHFGMFSASRRDHLDLLERSNQLILELKHLDSTPAQCRMTYKVAVLYVAPGQEDKQSILCNRSGSKAFKDFVAGLGWEVNMKTHAGYMGGLKRDFCAHTTLPYYATSSEEVLFHVSTRMPSKGMDVEQKVRHLGNDEVHIVWSEHWRDYRRTIFKTQFADILIVIYPLPNRHRLFRIQIIKKQKQNIPLFGPLFDGALVNKESLPSLVRATAINALRAQRSPLVGYRGRYEERLKYIQTIIQRKMKSSFEDFTQNVMHPLESSSHPVTTRVSTRNQTPELEPLPVPLVRWPGSETRSSRPPDPAEETGGSADTTDSSLPPSHGKGGQSPRLTRLRLSNMVDSWSPPPLRRPRSNTSEDNRPHNSKSGSSELHKHRLPRNQSVPEKLHRLHHSEDDRTIGLSTSGSNLAGRRPVTVHVVRQSPMARLSVVVPNRSGSS